MLDVINGPVSSATLFTGTATATVGSLSTAEVSVVPTGTGSMTLAANTLIVGRSLQLAITGYCKSNGDSITLRFKFGSTVLVTVALATPTALTTNSPFLLTYRLTCRTVGATGTVIGQGHFYHFDGGSAFKNAAGSATTATVTVDTTASNLVDATVQFGASSANNVINTTTAILQVLY